MNSFVIAQICPSMMPFSKVRVFLSGPIGKYGSGAKNQSAKINLPNNLFNKPFTSTVQIMDCNHENINH